MKWIFSIYLLASLQVAAQKTDRAAGALSDQKYGKAAELFQDVIEKNPNNLSALMGYTFTKWSASVKLNQAQSKEDLEMCMVYLKRADSLSLNYSAEDKLFMEKKLQCYLPFAEEINLLKIFFSTQLWQGYYSVSSNLDEVLLFYRTNAFGATVLDSCYNKISQLSFIQVQKINSIEGYNNFLISFSRTPEAALARAQLESLEYENALAKPEVKALEALKKKYPQSTFQERQDNALATLYTTGLSEMDQKSQVKQLKSKLLTLLQTSLIQNLIADCDLKIYEIDFNHVMALDNISECNRFLENYKNYAKANLPAVIQKRFELMRDNLLSDSKLRYKILVDYLKETSGIDSINSLILQKVSDDLKQRGRTEFRDLVINYFKQINISQVLSDILLNAICEQINFNESNINQVLLFHQIRNNNEEGTQNIIKALLRKTGLMNSYFQNTFFVKPAKNNGIDNWENVSFYCTGPDGKVLKKMELGYNVMTGTYENYPEMKTSHPLYSALKSKYNLNHVTSPSIVQNNERGYDVITFGYRSSDKSCCPSYEIHVQYNSERTPQNIISIEENNINFGSEDKILPYYKIGEELLIEHAAYINPENNSNGIARDKDVTKKDSSKNTNLGCVSGNCINGFGTYYFSNGEKYVGYFKDGKYHGQGNYTFPSGEKYEGEYLNGLRNGQGTYIFPIGSKYVGNFRDGKYHGKGTFTFPSGEKYEGEYLNGVRNGQGTFTFPSGEIYKGNFRDGKYHGYGVLTYSNGGKYEGDFVDDVRNGQGTYTFPNGEIKSGYFKDGKLIE